MQVHVKHVKLSAVKINYNIKKTFYIRVVIKCDNGEFDRKPSIHFSCHLGRTVLTTILYYDLREFLMHEHSQTCSVHTISHPCFQLYCKIHSTFECGVVVRILEKSFLILISGGRSCHNAYAMFSEPKLLN